MGLKALRYSTVFVTIASVDNEMLVQFYTQFFKQKPIVYIPNSYAEFQLSSLRLGIFKPKDNHQSEFNGQTSGGMSLCIEVERLEEAIAHLTTLGYLPSGDIITASHGREIYAYDPAGNRLILHES